LKVPRVDNIAWILFDTETTGLSAPIFVVELAAQQMRGWSAESEPFRRLLNQNQEIPAEASRVHGYTREILERDGEPAQQVYREFAAYAGTLPLVSFNLEYDLDEVLQPEWRRLRITPAIFAIFGGALEPSALLQRQTLLGFAALLTAIGSLVWVGFKLANEED
jgi:DNA polymerase III epsilon subunit-like protein